MQNETGKTYGRLIVIRRSPVCRCDIWQCRCLCGKVTNIKGCDLRRGQRTGCGCIGACKETHGHARYRNVSSEYGIWQQMRYRCNNQRNKDYAYYGGRGISVCQRWDTSFTAFLQDMGSRPSRKHSIDRIDNDGNYCPENCRWATHSQQMTNRSGSTGTTEIARQVGINPRTLRDRIKRGWSLERATSTPVARAAARCIHKPS